ncbi:MAG: helix-turn-helix domain-containing protein [Acidobacteriaceae bacterium]|nr:helix-turn-helix domain-containing protein [Acidobacteriaceae bacterium]
MKLREHQSQNQQLRRLALREMSLLEHTLCGAGRILMLADATGVILDSQGDNTFLGRARTVALMPGATWAEQMTGTNAIGTAIIEHRFLQVTGRQHFFDENCFLSCQAMPIMSPSGGLAGVLNLSGDVHISLHSAGRLVRQAVAHIEHSWVEETATDIIVRLHQHPAWLGTPEEGVLTFHDGLLTGANTHALVYLGLAPLAIHSARWEEIFQQRPQLGRRELHRLHHSGLFYAEISRAFAAGARIAATEVAHVGPESLADLRDEALRRAVSAENGNLSAAARRLGIHRSTLYRRLGKQ